MTMWLWMLVVLSAGMNEASSRGQTATNMVEEVVVPAGDIPEHWVWRSAFQYLAFIKKEEERLGEKVIPLAQLPDGQILRLEMSTEGLGRARQAALAQEKRGVACGTKLEERARELRGEGKTREEIARALEEPRIACRQEVLDARDGLLSVLSNEDATNLRLWVDSRRYGMHVLWPKAELEHFKRPR